MQAAFSEWERAKATSQRRHTEESRQNRGPLRTRPTALNPAQTEHHYREWFSVCGAGKTPHRALTGAPVTCRVPSRWQIATNGTNNRFPPKKNRLAKAAARKGAGELPRQKQDPK